MNPRSALRFSLSCHHKSPTRSFPRWSVDKMFTCWSSSHQPLSQSIVRTFHDELERRISHCFRSTHFIWFESPGSTARLPPAFAPASEKARCRFEVLSTFSSPSWSDSKRVRFDGSALGVKEQDSYLGATRAARICRLGRCARLVAACSTFKQWHG